MVGFENIEITLCSRVFNNTTGNEIKGWLNKAGYRRLHLANNGNKVKKYWHRFWADTWLENPLNLPEVHHGDGVRDNNKPPNLSRCTHQENMKYVFQKNHLLPKNEPVVSSDEIEDLPF